MLIPESKYEDGHKTDIEISRNIFRFLNLVYPLYINSHCLVLKVQAAAGGLTQPPFECATVTFFLG